MRKRKGYFKMRLASFTISVDINKGGMNPGEEVRQLKREEVKNEKSGEK